MHTFKKYKKIGLGILVLGVMSCADDAPQNAQEKKVETLPAVEVVQARLGQLPLRERLTGTVRAGGQVVIYPEISGTVLEVLAENGDEVKKGDALVKIRAETSASQLRQAQADLARVLAERNRAQADLENEKGQFERTQTLAADSLVSREALESARAQLSIAEANFAQMDAAVEAARAGVTEREEALAKSVVRAPIGGRLGQRKVQVGMRVDGQTALFTIGRLEDVRVDIAVPQEMLVQFEVGQAVEIGTNLDATRGIRAEISRISPFLEAGSFTGAVEIDVPAHQGRLLPGMFVEVDVLYGRTAQMTVLPKSALYENPNSGDVGVYIARTTGDQIQMAEGDTIGAIMGPVEFVFHSVDIQTSERQMVAVSNVLPEAWVVVMGQYLLSLQSSTEPVQARLRPLSWARILELQGLQREDVLMEFLEKQQRIARSLTQTPPAENAVSK
ncbi:MAG: efflux RND transporter periplasmic adaptor subunit [Candidatus Latescibacterota bacterium]|jgi:HlyD family secretion protein